MTWGRVDDHFAPRDVCDLDPVATREPRYEDAVPPHSDPNRSTAAPLTRPYIHVTHTKTAGWRVLYNGSRSLVPVLMARGLTEEQARAVGRAHGRVHDCPVEVDS